MFLCAALLTVQAQPLYFERIDIKDGLSQNTVNEIIQDSRGFMWFGTKDGLNRYDGMDFKVFKARPHDRSMLGNNQIRSLVEDKAGNILVGTNAGLWRYDVLHDCFSEIVITDDSGGGIPNPVLCMAMDPLGRIYVSVEAAGVYRYDPETGEITCRYSTKKPLHTLEIDNATGTVWMSWPGEGLFYTEDDFATVHQFLLPDGNPVYPDDIISCILIGGYNRLYLGLENNGVVLLNKATAQMRKLPLSDGPLFVRQILQFSAEELWIGSESGLYIYNTVTGKVSHVSGSPHDHYSLSDNAIHSMYKDRDGGVWVGTFFGGVNYLPERVPRFRKWYYTDGSNGLDAMRVKEICPDGKGCLWIGTEDAGLYHFDPSSGVFRFFEPSRDFSNIHGIMMDGDELWVTTFSKGIQVIDTRTWKVVRQYDTNHPQDRRLFSNYVFALEKTSMGRIYIGTMHGLQYYNDDEDNFGYVPQINGGKMVNDIKEDSSGNLWVGTVSNGLYVMGNDGRWKQYIHHPEDESSLPSNNVISVFEDSRKRIWVTTEGAGFCRFDDGKFTDFTSVDGMPSDVVYQIVEDEYGNFWISTNKGLVLFDADRCRVSRIYTTENGLLCNQFNYKSGYRAPDGTIYFGSIEGLVAFRPDVLLDKVDKSLPPIYITGFSLLDGDMRVGDSGCPLQKDITCTDVIELKHDRNTFSLSFVALDYRKDNRLVYKMQGLDTKWLEYSGTPVIYSNISAGNYTFRVRLADDTEGAGERTLQIKVRPPFWWSAVARIIYLLLLLSAIVYGLNMYHRRTVLKRSKYITEYEKKKELEIYNTKISFFTNITHEIRTPLTLIKAPLDNILANGKVNPEIREDLGIISRNADRLLTLVNQLLDFEKIEKEKLSLSLRPETINDIVQDVVERFRLSFRQQDKDFAYSAGDGDIVAMVDNEAFTKIVSNMFTNALKYSETKIRVNLSKEGGMCRLVVLNDGELIPENKREAVFEPFYRQTSNSNKTGTGIGLYLARQLAELQGGRLVMDVRDGMNEFVLTVPLCAEGVAADASSDSKGSGHEETEEELMAYIGAGETILVVEDDLEMCGFIKKYLSSTWSVLTAHNGIEALDVLEKNQVTLIVSDIMMPGMDGIKFCKTVKKDFRYNHIPIVLLTAKTGLESRIKGMNVGADAYIEKPFSLPYLTSVITNQIKSRKMLREAFTKSPLTTMNTANLAANDTDFLVALQKIVYDNISNADFRIDDAIDIMNMGRATFYRKIKGIFDMSPNDYLRLERLKVAADLLKNGSMQISEVCYMVGFTSPSYFTKCFTRQFGETPKHFMKKENINIKPDKRQ